MNTQRHYRRTAPILAAVLTAVVLLPAAARAQQRLPRVDVTIEVKKEVVHVTETGDEVRELHEVGTVAPGDVLVYTVRARNTGSAAAANPRIVDPIPDGTVLVLDGFERPPLPADASVDGGKTWIAYPAQIELAGADGETSRVPAPAERYTHLRWVLPGSLEPGQSRDVSFKVRVR